MDPQSNDPLADNAAGRSSPPLAKPPRALIDRLVDDLWGRWQKGERVLVETYLEQYPALQADTEGVVDLLYNEFHLRTDRGESLTLADYVKRFPQLARQLQDQFEVHKALPPESQLTLATQVPKDLSHRAEHDSYPPRLPDGPCPLPSQIAEEKWPEVPGYEILGVLGRGGMGVVYTARQLTLNRLVALKMILAGGHADAEQRRRFHTEAEAVARLQHPNVVQIYETGEQAGLPYFSLEFVDGGSLAQQINGTPLPPRRSAEIITTLARAMHAAHQHDIVHRDLKPANVLLTSDGTPKITDFGLAKVLDDGTRRTASDAILGTPSYMAPEQAGGRRKEIGPAVDIYALGAILYELLSGRPPFKAATAMDTVLQVISDDPVPLRQLQSTTPRDLETICLKCLHKEPPKRYPTAQALADDLRRFLTGEPILARRVGAAERGWRWCRRNPALAAALGVVAGLTVTFVVLQGLALYRLAAEQQRTQAALNDSQRLTAELAFDKGQLLGEQGDTHHALLWMARSLQLAPADAGALQGVIRTNLMAWRSRIHPLRMILPHETEVAAVAFTPDGKTCLTAGLDQTIRRWDGSTGAASAPPLLPDSPSGWNAETPSLRFSGGNVEVVLFSPGGETLLIGTREGEVRVLDTASGHVRWTRRQEGMITTAAFSPDRTLVLIGYAAAPVPLGIPPRGKIQLWKLATGQPLLRQPLDHQQPVYAAAFHPDGQTFVTADGIWGNMRDAGTARFWNLAGAEIRKPLAQPRGSLAVAFRPDGKQLLIGHWDYEARLWDLAQDQLLLSLPHASPVGSVAFSPDGKSILTGCFGGTAQLWDRGSGKPLSPPLMHPAGVNAVAFRPDGQTLVTGAADNTARLWEVPAASTNGSVEPHRPATFPLAFSLDGKILLTQEMDHSVQLRDAVRDTRIGVPLRHNGLVLVGAVSPDGQSAVTVGDDNTVRLWQVATGKPLAPLRHPEQVFAAAFSPTGSSIVTGSLDGTARSWDAATGEPMGAFRHFLGGPVFGVAFSPDGQTVVTGGADSSARLWDIATGQPRGEPLAHHKAVLAVAFGPAADRPTLLTGGSDSTARLWDLATGKLRGPPLGHRRPVRAVAFSPDGRTLLTGSQDGTARLWDAATCQPLGPPLRHTGPVHHVAFWHDGQTLMTAGEDRHTRFWPVPTPLAGDADQLERWIQMLTNTELEVTGGVRVLDAAAWQERRRQLEGMGLPAPVSP